MKWLSSLILRRGPRHLLTGRWGEDQAERFLKKQGYRIVGRRVRVGERDELDLVARREEVLVFVEVKTRKNEDLGRPLSAVTKAKRRYLSRAAIRYMERLGPARRPPYFRFDVVEVVGQPDDANPLIRHIENAFTLYERYRLPW